MKQVWTALTLLALLMLCLLGKGNLESNEAGKLALALQQIRPNWIPNDWYLNTPQHYQWLFQQFAGQLLEHLGVTWGSLIIRIAGYSAWAWAVARLCVKIGLNPALSAGAVAVFLVDQSMIAREWMVSSGEPKTFAYAATILAFLAWRNGQKWSVGLWSGIACSFHVLVGSYGSLALCGLALIRRRDHNLKRVIQILTGFTVGLIPLLLALSTSLTSPKTPLYVDTVQTLPEDISATWVYTYIRNPHHLVPSSWSTRDWLWACLWLALFATAIFLVFYKNQSGRKCQQDLAVWASLTLAPFIIGLGISPWDSQGIWLRFYPFRVADTLIPHSTCLILASEAQHRIPRISSFLAIVLAAAISIQQAADWLPDWGERLAYNLQSNTQKREL